MLERAALRLDINNKIVYQSSKSVYDQFDLVLPKDTSVSRLNEHTIQIDTTKFVLSIDIIYNSISAVLQRIFQKYNLE